MTIATNMAGRGTDILLGGNPEFLATPRHAAGRLSVTKSSRTATGHSETDDEEVLDAAQTLPASCMRSFKKETDAEHEQRDGSWAACTSSAPSATRSRRIDNQLRGRAGRQGDPGSTPVLYLPGGRPDAPLRLRAHRRP